MNMLENMTWPRLAAVFCLPFILVTPYLFGAALLQGHSVDAIVSRFLSIDMIASIFLVSISFLISALWRYKLVWIFVSIVPSLIWQPVGCPFILVTRFDKFSWLPALVTLAMTILFWLLEKLVAKHEGSDNSAVGVGYSFGDPDEMITLSLDEKKKTKGKKGGWPL